MDVTTFAVFNLTFTLELTIVILSYLRIHELAMKKTIKFHKRFSFYPVLFYFIMIRTSIYPHLLTYSIRLYFLTLKCLSRLNCLTFTWRNDNIVELQKKLRMLGINLTKKKAGKSERRKGKGVRLGMRK